MRAAFPGSVLAVGNLGFASGEEIPWSVSHQAGRDADLGMYATAVDGRPVEAMPFYAFDDSGMAAGPGGRPVRFDPARNLKLVVTLVGDAEARVQYIFVASWLKQRLLAEADSSLVGFARLLAQNMIMLQQADSAGIPVPEVNWQAMQLTYRVSVDQLTNALGLNAPEFAPDSTTEAQRAQLAADRVNSYINALATGQAPNQQLIPGLVAKLRSE